MILFYIALALIGMKIVDILPGWAFLIVSAGLFIFF